MKGMKRMKGFWERPFMAFMFFMCRFEDNDLICRT